MFKSLKSYPILQFTVESKVEYSAGVEESPLEPYVVWWIPQRRKKR